MQEFARVQRGDFTPADCIRCGRDTDLLDLGAGNVENYGRPYFCTNCFAELADKMEYVTPQELAATKTVLKKQISDRMLERDAARLQITQLLAEADSSPAAILERFAADVINLVRDLDGRGGPATDGAVSLPAPAGEEKVGRDELDAGAGGGTEDDAHVPSPSRKRGPARGRTRAVPAASEGESGVPAGDPDHLVEGDGAGPSDLDEWLAGLGEFDDETADLSSGNVGD